MFEAFWFCMDEGYMLVCGCNCKNDIFREGGDVEE
jgi:hypothetical protein